MGILDDDVARVREATDLVALAGEHIALKRVGRRFMGLCPFHTEKTPSFTVDSLNSRVYAELFLTPESDPWLGLAPRNQFSALENGGLVE